MMDVAREMQLLVLQPTPYCNLDCAYCYLPDRADRRSMSLETLDAIGSNILARPISGDKPSIVWHGGEPMTLQPDWYESAFARLAAAATGKRLRHSFQTNAVGTSEDWIALWRRWNVRIGVSLDGPPELHNARRVTRSGRGSFDLTMAGVRRLQAAGLSFHVISVLTREALEQPDRMLDFYLEHDLRDVCFNIEEQEGANETTSLGGRGVEAAYAAFLARITDRVERLSERFACREIDSVKRLAVTPQHLRRRNPQVSPLGIVTVAVDGGMSTFSPELLGTGPERYGGFVFGNVKEGPPEAMLADPGFRRVRDEIRNGVEACARSCAHFDVCGGGAPANKLSELGDFCGTETLYCRLTRKAALEGVMRALESRTAA